MQKREVLSDPKLPPEFRVALAKSLQDNLFTQVFVSINKQFMQRFRFVSSQLILDFLDK
jgi:hypothetical protein